MSTFVNYLHGGDSLEQRVSSTFDRLCIEPDLRLVIGSFLAPLRDKGQVYKFHYDHTLRVALLCVDVAKFTHLDQKALFYAGLLHDIGKVQVPAETLGKTSGWTQRDSAVMRPHVMDGYRMLRGRFDFTAEVIIWHHRFQAQGYPHNVPSKLHAYCLGSKTMIQMYGRLLSLCDQFDAFHRINDKHGELHTPSGEEIKALMFKLNPDQAVLLGELYGAEVFTTYVEMVQASTIS